MLGKTTNPLLQQTEQGIQAKVPQNLQMAFQRTVTAGLTLMYSPGMQNRMMQGLDSTPNPVDNAALGAVNLTVTLMNQSRGSMPPTVAAPVAMILLCEILSFLEQAGKAQVTPDVLAQAAQSVAHHLLTAMQVSQSQLHQVVAQGMSGAQAKIGAGPAPAQAGAPAPRAGIINSARGVQ